MVERSHIISLDIHQLTFNESLELVMNWALNKKSAYVCFANVHMTIEANNDKAFSAKVNAADLVLADGKPIAVACNLFYHKKQERICGMDFTPLILERANEKKLSGENSNMKPYYLTIEFSTSLLLYSSSYL